MLQHTSLESALIKVRLGINNMTCLEHYFENLLFDGEDVKDNCNKNELSEEQQKAVEMCAQYVLYSLFCNREDFKNFLEMYRNYDVLG